MNKIKQELYEYENNLITNKHILLYGNKNSIWNDITNNEFNYIINNFCGQILNYEDYNKLDIISEDKSLIYFCGEFINLDKIKNNIFIIKNLTFNLHELKDNMIYIDSGKVPINIYNIGVLFRNFFDSNENYFDNINNTHIFQSLTESNKPTNAYRTGIYLTPVIKNNDTIDTYEFNLLRCSSNFEGPTENFKEIDNKIVEQLNEIAYYYFDKKTCLNHILAQIYHNNSGKKAKIKEHSDKTKDMPRNGLMAFCSFYKDYINNNFSNIKKSKIDYFDYCYKDISVLTKLNLKEKKTNNEYDVILYPNSVFFMSLSSNRLYTHEIIPSHLSIEHLPIRMGCN